MIDDPGEIMKIVATVSPFKNPEDFWRQHGIDAHAVAAVSLSMAQALGDEARRGERDLTAALMAAIQMGATIGRHQAAFHKEEEIVI